MTGCWDQPTQAHTPTTPQARARTSTSTTLTRRAGWATTGKLGDKQRGAEAGGAGLAEAAGHLRRPLRPALQGPPPRPLGLGGGGGGRAARRARGPPVAAPQRPARALRPRAPRPRLQHRVPAPAPPPLRPGLRRAGRRVRPALRSRGCSESLMMSHWQPLPT
eukprot:1486276-Rhodomonas_salina.1